MTIETINGRIVCITGSMRSGKTSLAEAMARRLNATGTKAMWVSMDFVYRVVAQLSESGELTDAQLRFYLASRSIIFSNELQVEINGRPHDHIRLYNPPVTRIMAAQRNSSQIRSLVLELVRRTINDFDGWVIVEGRACSAEFSPRLAIHLKVMPWAVNARADTTVPGVIGANRAARRHPFAPLRRVRNDFVIRTTRRTIEEICDQALAHLRWSAANFDPPSPSE